MKKWFSAMIIFVAVVYGNADARSYRPVAGGRGAEGQEPAPPAAVPAPAPAPSAPVPSPSQPVPAGGTATPAAPGANESQIFVWKEGNVLRATNNLSDVPPRYSKRVESADGNPKVIRMVADDEKPRSTKPVKKIQKKPSRRHGHNTSR